MSTPRKPKATSRKPAPQPMSPPPLPPTPPLTKRQLVLQQDISARLQGLVYQAEQQNLDRAVCLAQQAARRQGPLVQYFLELGRRYKDYEEEAPEPRLRAIEGGREA